MSKKKHRDDDDRPLKILKRMRPMFKDEVTSDVMAACALAIGVALSNKTPRQRAMAAAIVIRMIDLAANLGSDNVVEFPRSEGHRA